MATNDRVKLRRIVLGRLESLQQAGVLQLPTARLEAPQLGEPKSHPAAKAVASTAERVGYGNEMTAVEARKDEQREAAKDVVPSMAKKSGWQASPATSLFETPASVKEIASGLTLEVLQQQVASCTRCNELASTRTQTVFGVGNPHARLCFLGEAPGADEDRTGIPFVGRGGQLLDKIIEACQLKREDVYILNTIKCRPPGNRNPLPHELSNCRAYLESQLDFIRPEFICCLGAVPSQNLLGTTISIGKLRGKFHSFRGAKVVCTYHPAFLLRSPSFKKQTWEDMKMLMREMGVEL